MNSVLPAWFKQDLPDPIALAQMRFLSELRVKTVCQEAKCPNFARCFSKLKLTFMILGDICTRSCRFCAVTKSNGKTSRVIDSEEPKRIQEAVKKLGLDYVVITSVTRDDLIDGGAGIFAETIKLIRALEKNIKVEVLIPDFKGRSSSLKSILDTSPDVIGHNLETVRRLFSSIRPQANYELSLEILRQVKKTNPRFITKSSLMLGLGETGREVKETLQDLRQARCDILTLGQYLAPSPKHYPVKEYIDLEKFIQYKELAVNLGFKKVLSGPLVRSSYQAEELYREFSYV